MGTYTTNYNLFMPSVGEQGWGDLVNGNFATIDTTMKGLNTRMGTAETNITSLTTRMGTAEMNVNSNRSRIGTLETTTNAMKEKLDAIEVTDGVLEGKYAGEFTGRVYLDKCNLASGQGDILLNADIAQQTLNIEHGETKNGAISSSVITVNGFSNFTFPLKVAPNLWVRSEDDILNLDSMTGITTRNYTFTARTSYGDVSPTSYFYVNGSAVASLSASAGNPKSQTGTIPIGATCYIKSNKYGNCSVSISSIPAVYIDTL